MIPHPMSTLIRCLLLVLAVPLATLAAQESRLTATAAVGPSTARPGDEVTLEVRCAIEFGWHIYGKQSPNEPTRLSIVAPTGLEAVGDPEIPDGEEHLSFGDVDYWIEGEAVLRQRFKVLPSATNGAMTLGGTVDYMACTPEGCDPPDQAKFTATLRIEGGQDPKPLGVTGWIGKKSIDKVRFRVRVEPSVLRVGERGTMHLEVEMAPHWHVYGSGDLVNPPTELQNLSAAGLGSVGVLDVPTGEQVGSGESEMWILEEEFEARQSFVVMPGASVGTIEWKGDFAYQTCDESGCLPPATEAFTVQLMVEAGAARPEHAATAEQLQAAIAMGAAATTAEVAAAPIVGRTGYEGGAAFDAAPRQLEPKFQSAEDKMDSLWQLILLCIGGGLIALIMPCTYPMIPITFSFFTKQAEMRGGKVLSLALTYGLGIVLIFVLIGLLVGPIIINFAAHWATNLVIGLAFLLFAAALFGWIVLQPPAFLTRASGKATARGGLFGVFLMGATLVVTSFTCTAPIVGSLLAGGASGDIGLVDLSIGMAFFGLTMATPFVFLAMLPGRVKALPKSGEWMHTLKVALGFIELAAALKFLSNFELALDLQLMPREWFLGIWALVFVLLGLYLLGPLRSKASGPHTVAGLSKVSGLLALAFAVFCGLGVTGMPLGSIMTAFEPPYQLREVLEHRIVKDDHDLAVETARNEKKYLLVNFTGFS
jgi:thiol:disulfide interchange protein